ncbi:glycoside hydrolase family 66 protein [Salinibacterium sp. ZJ450]|uniref:glycoside hydrolase family 66 protein n=1 Tax=Salinibacterium sp. ZJ450 TaxID=2708338 RepID=UPI0014216F88|nr:glycoside hydrolase family 66 protein [Salinibacterium sp. ZJ450]
MVDSTVVNSTVAVSTALLMPDRAGYSPGEEVTIDFGTPLASDGELHVTQLHHVLRTVLVDAGATSASLGQFECGGYGVRFAAADGTGGATAFDVLATPFARPRYGFVVRLTSDVDIDAVARNFRRMHLNIAQLYDWAYRHSTLMPPSEHYLDPLGQEREISVVNRMSQALSDGGTSPLGYSAVYAIGASEVENWQGSILTRSDGEPYRLGENFLVLVDPSEPAWLEHYLAELERVVRESKIEGFHLDQYGWPKFARRSDGASVDLAASFVTLLNAIRERLPDTPFMFNNVNDFPTYATAGTGQDATYIEVWEPHSTLQDLAGLALSARAHRPEHPPILSAYLSCYRDGEVRANAAAALVMATAWSHGASHLLLGEDGNALVHPYYPDNHPLAAGSLDFFATWYDFQVRYGDLFYGPEHADVTEFFTGGINEDVVFEHGSTRFSTKAEAGAVWTRVVRTPHGLVVHLINLVSQSETRWDAGKSETSVIGHGDPIVVKIAPINPGSSVWFAAPESPEMIQLTPTGMGAGRQHDALSAGQSSVVFELPPLAEWGIVLIPIDGS